MYFPNGSRMVIGHFNAESDIDAYLGIEYDLMIVEELNTISKVKVDLLLGSLRTSKPDWHPRLYGTFNPGGVGHGHVKKTFIDPAKAGNEELTRFIDCGVEDNPFVNDSYRRFLEGLTGWLKRAWLFGDWDILAGQFFTTWYESAHTYNHAVPGGQTYWLALDYGRVHWNVVLLFALMGDTIYVMDEYASRFTSVREDASNTLAMLARHNLSLNDMYAMPAGHDIFTKTKRGEQHDKSIADDWHEYGFEWETAVTDRINGAAEILRLLGNPREAQPALLQIHQRCTGLIERIPLMEHDPHRPEDILKHDCDENGEGGDDHVDCLRYGVMAAPGSGQGQWMPNPMAGYRG
jgi:phage terminase large subunit